VRASPVARRLAAEHGSISVNSPAPAQAAASSRDVLRRTRAAPSRNFFWLPHALESPRPRAAHRRTQTIADRLRRTLETAVSLTLTREVRAEALVAARADLAVRIGASISFDALLLKIFAAALRERPALHAVIDEGEILLLDEIHLGLAVSVPESAGGLVPR
jgi:pyruvate dehydrogenase E2 component (dihydrolipoamide acetyltransferase)